jgi:hypothetical protein
MIARRPSASMLTAGTGSGDGSSRREAKAAASGKFLESESEAETSGVKRFTFQCISLRQTNTSPTRFQKKAP